MIDLDPSIIDQESIRKKRRHKLLKIAIGPVALIILFALFFLRLGVFDFLYGMNYSNPSASSIVSLSQMQKHVNILEPYIALYESGTALIKDSQFEKAEADLRESLLNNPPADTVCMVRVNLSYSLEMQADAAKADQRYSAALSLLSKAEGVLYEDNCADPSNKSTSESKDEKAEKSKDRIEKKRNDVVSKMNGGDSGDGGGNDGGEGGSGYEISGDVVEQIQSQNLTNTEVYDEVHGRGGSGGPGGSWSAPTYQNW